MPKDLFYHPKIKEDLVALSKSIKIRIKKAIELKLCLDPLKFGLPLKRSLKGFRKMRVGDYRIIYEIKEHRIIILKIGHRREVYRNFNRK